ncbi:YgaP family membrane protein [Pseudomonas sp.]|uniref:YgaP family membrane protein n=1 Tax=Pseudomonas sp. TaxID=306 RepID=UPI003FD6F790
MSDSKTLRPIIESTPFQASPTQNVHGWERIGSVAGGVMMVGKGLRRGGIFGLLQVAIGGVALARGFTGHSSLKDKLEQGRQEMNSVRTKIERAGEALKNLKTKAQVGAEKATKTTV